MSDLDLEGLPPAPPDPPPVTAPSTVVAPWQERLEVIALLLLLAAAVTVVARLAGAFDQFDELASPRGLSVDLVDVVKFAGQQIGVLAAGSVLLAFLLVTLGPGDQISNRGVLVLRGAVVIGLVVAGIAAFAGVAALFGLGATSTTFAEDPSTARDAVDQVSTALPLLVAAAIAGYSAWCAFATLGEVPPGLVIPEAPAGVS